MSVVAVANMMGCCISMQGIHQRQHDGLNNEPHFSQGFASSEYLQILNENQKKNGANIPWNSVWIFSTDECFLFHHHLDHFDDFLCQQHTFYYHGGFCSGPDSFPDIVPAEIVSSPSIATTNIIPTIVTESSIGSNLWNGVQDIDLQSTNVDNNNRVGGIRWEQ